MATGKNGEKHEKRNVTVSLDPKTIQFFVSEKSDEANSLKTDGEPGRTRTSNPLIKRPSKDH